MDVRELQSINLAQILKEPGTAAAEGVIREAITAGEDVLPLQGEAEWSVTVTSAGEEFWLSGEVHGTVLMECRRCLKPTPQPVDAYFQHLLEFHPEVEELTLVQNEDDEDVYRFGEPDLDLSFFLAQAFALAMPYTALCDESCKGLCPVCGADLNVTDCGHVQGDAVSGALAELGKFLDEV
ncbi:YceD family protein [Deinococcota bacterium DY0809b]